jgi:hypothetical protein
MRNPKKYFIGYQPNTADGEGLGVPVLYDPADLTTHAVVVGMTGSGKTGLCIGLLEEAALNGTPALMIDPKGDITNALLHFPELRTEDFLPWIDPHQARRQGKTAEELAASTAELWRSKLAEQGMGQAELSELKNSVQFTVYTPGSDAGVPVSILASLNAPNISWEGNKEVLREKVSSTVTALLGLVGLRDIDPVRSREHILLSNIFEQAWSQGQDLDLGELIMQTQAPPFSKLGVFDVNTFYPEKDRFGLAMALNNILASPAFQVWIEGEPLDIPTLLYTSDGKPRHSIFYTAHLGEVERMFFTTLLLSALESWMRTQSGTSGLRAILYFDEIFGYLPPQANPSSKPLLLRLLKQARAFGVGLLLATQNPVDVDYKALSNAGTWFIGKLQTDQDKQRLLDGLQGAGDGSLNRAEFDRLISSLGKRVFLLHNVHARGPQVFQTRFVMNYLAGPLTRAQIPALNRLARNAPPALAAESPVSSYSTALDNFQPVPIPASGPPAGVVQKAGEAQGSQAVASFATRPSLPAGVREYFLPNHLTLSQALKKAGQAVSEGIRSQGLIYRPVILAQASVRFLNRKYNLDYEMRRTILLPEPDRRGIVRWENNLADPVDPNALDDQPIPEARFYPFDAPLNDSKAMAALQKDFLDWIHRSGRVTIWANEALKQYSGPERTEDEFRALCEAAALQAGKAEQQKIHDGYEKKIAVLQNRLAREERELSEDQTRLSQRKMEEVGTHAENVFGLFSRRSSSRRLSTSLSKRRLTEQAKAAVDESHKAIADFKKQITALEKERDESVESAARRWQTAAADITEVPVVALKKDVHLELFGVGWMPYHVFDNKGLVGEVFAYE